MIMGHFASALVPRALRVPVPLSLLFVASNLPDFIWFALAALGAEPTTPTSFLDVSLQGLHADMQYSHSAAVDVAIAVVFGAIVFAVTRSRSAGLWCGGLVVGHLVCDWLSGFEHGLGLHGSPMVGFNLYASAPGVALAIEVVFAALCVAVSLRLREAPHLVSTRQKLALYGAFVGGILMFAPTASLTARELAARFGVEF